MMRRMVIRRFPAARECGKHASQTEFFRDPP